MKTKITSIILSLCLVFSCFSCFGILNVSAASVTDSTTGLIFDTSTGAITGYTGNPTNLVIPSTINGVSVTSIGSCAFDGCSSLTSVTIPASVTSIDDGAFWYCSSLYWLIIPTGVTTIGNNAFDNCSNLYSVTISSSVTNIGTNAFGDCNSLTAIYVDPANLNYSSINGVLFNKNATTLLQFPCTNATTSYIIPTSVTCISDYAFYECKSLTSVSIPSSVKSIDEYAFADCSRLTSVVIPANVTSLGDDAFDSCFSLYLITIPSSITSLGRYVFKNCSYLTTVNLSSGVTSIGFGEFYLCSKLSSITIPTSVRVIADGAFYGCSALTGVTIPSGVASINTDAFSNCSALTQITIPNTVTSINSAAFMGCSSLPGVTIPTSVTSINTDAFFGCTSLTGVTIPSSVTSIGSDAFYDCSSLTGVTIPSSVTSIKDDVFENCLRLIAINVDNSNTNFTSLNGVLYNKLATTLIEYPCGNTSYFYIMPSSVTSIGINAFLNCTSLTSMIILNSVVNIGYNALDTCSNLTIYGQSGSYVKTYATTNSITFKDISLFPPSAPAIIPSTTSPTNQNVTVTISASANTTIQYSLDSGATWNNYTAPLTISENATIFSKDTNLVGVTSINSSLIISNIDKTPPVAPTIIPSTTSPTTKNITVTISAEANALIQYSTDSGATWITYNSIITISSDTTILAKAVDLAGNISPFASLTISNIYKIPPPAPTITPNTTSPTNQNLTVTISAVVNTTIQYSTDNGVTWNNYTSPFSISTNTTIIANATDPAGNISTNSTLAITNIDKIPPAAPKITSSTASPTNKNITVTITAETGSSIRYSTNNGKTWNNYSAPLAISANTTILASATDLAGNTSGYGTLVISNIDKTPPKIVGVSNNAYYKINKKITFNEGTAKLNGKSFKSGTTVSSAGVYTLVVTDTVGNTSVAKFTIDKTSPTITVKNTSKTVIANGGTSSKNVIVTFSDTNYSSKSIKLNGKKINWSSNNTFTSSGTYTVTVTDKAGNSKTVGFKIKK